MSGMVAFAKRLVLIATLEPAHMRICKSFPRCGMENGLESRYLDLLLLGVPFVWKHFQKTAEDGSFAQTVGQECWRMNNGRDN